MLSLTKGLQSPELLKELLNDPVTSLITDFINDKTIDFEDIMFLRRLADKGEGTRYDYHEVMLFVDHHREILNLIKSPKGSKVYLAFYKQNANCYFISGKLNIRRPTVIKWVDRFLKMDIMFIDQMLGGNEKFLILNKGRYRNILFIIRWLIMEEQVKV